MIRALLMVIGLTIAASAAAATTTGSIAVSLTIYSRCAIVRPDTAALPAVDCGKQASAQPRITQRVLSRDAQRHETARLVTIEW